MRSLALILCLCSGLAAAATVRVDGGNVYLDEPGHPSRPLTQTGRDRDAQLSPDGTRVVFIRDLAAAPAADESPPAELRVLNLRDRGEQVLAATGQACGRNPDLQALASPQFLADSRRIVFESAFVATSSSTHLVAVDGGGCRFIAPSNGVDVVRAGPHQDRLILSQHRYFLAGGSYDWYWLYTVEGEEIGPVGMDESAVALFLEESGDGA